MQKQSNLKKSNSKKSNPKKTNSKKSNFGNRLILILGLALASFIFVVIITSVILFFTKDSDLTTSKIMDKLSAKIPSITDVINYSEANDPNGIMGQANQYTSKSSWEDTRIANHQSEYAGTIEVFKNVKDAELREWRINLAKDACERQITTEKYGTTITSGWVCREYYMYRKDTVVIRLSSSFTDDQITEYKTALNSIIDGFVVPDIDTPSTDRINELRSEAEASLDTIMSEQEANLQSGLDGILNDYINRLNAISESLNEDELASAKEELAFFKEGSYYSSKIAALEQKINDIEAKIAEQKRQAEAAAAQAAAEKLAQKNRRLGAGKYTTCTDIDSGTYDVTAISGNGNLFVNSDSYSHYVNEIMSASGAYGWNREYKNMILSCGDVLEIKNGLTVQLTAKR